MKFNFFIFFTLSTFFSLNATDIEWDGKTSLNAANCREKSKRFMPADDLKSIVFSMNEGLLHICKNTDSFIKIRTEGSKRRLNNITFFRDHNGYYLKDKNNSEQISPIPKIGTTNTCVDNIVFSKVGTHISHSYSGTKVHGMCIKQDSSKNQNLISQQTLLKEAGEDSIYEMMSLNNVSLKDLRMGTRGLVISGQIISGEIEQNGKIYGPGTVFNDETSFKLNIPSTSAPDKNIKKLKSEKPTLIILYLPKTTYTWDFSFQGTGDSRIREC